MKKYLEKIYKRIKPRPEKDCLFLFDKHDFYMTTDPAIYLNTVCVCDKCGYMVKISIWSMLFVELNRENKIRYKK